MYLPLVIVSIPSLMRFWGMFHSWGNPIVEKYQITIATSWNLIWTLKDSLALVSTIYYCVICPPAAHQTAGVSSLLSISCHGYVIPIFNILVCTMNMVSFRVSYIFSEFGHIFSLCLQTERKNSNSRLMVVIGVVVTPPVLCCVTLSEGLHWNVDTTQIIAVHQRVF